MDFSAFQTKQELDNLINDFKRFNTAFRFFALAVYITFIVYCIVTGAGYLALNIFLLVISTAYLAFVIVVTVREARGEDTTKADKIAAKIYRWMKFAAIFVSAVLSVVGVLTAVEEATPLSVVLAILLPVCLILQAILDLAIVWITARVKRFQIALAEDVNTLKQDMVKLAIGLVKESLFSRKRREEDGEVIVVGSDELLSVREMKRVGERKKKPQNAFVRVWNKIFKPNTEKKQSGTGKDKKCAPTEAVKETAVAALSENSSVPVETVFDGDAK